MKDKFKNKLCDSKMTFEECELAILRQAVDETEKKQNIEKVNNETVQNILDIVVNFIKKKKLVCYGGTAINNILPESQQFYNKETEIPDYDFFSDNPLKHAKELADIYYKEGYKEIEAKSGMHFGTFKVFVNYIPIADITYLHPEIFAKISKESLKVDGIQYAPPNYLRMAAYLELSRPLGDVSRWEKVYKRLSLLNKHYPLKTNSCHNELLLNNVEHPTNDLNNELRDLLIKNKVIFFGGYSAFLYSKYMNEKDANLARNIAEFDVLCEDPEKVGKIILDSLKENDYKKLELLKHKEIGEIIPLHYELKVEGKSRAFFFKPISCHSYNKIRVNKKTVHVATVETILSFYLAFLYAEMPYYNKDRLLCLSESLLRVIEHNKLNDRGILKRFTIQCYGKPKSLQDIRSEKSDKFKEFQERKVDHDSKEYNMWFLKYTPKGKQNKTIKNNIKSKNKTLKMKTSTFLI